MEQDRRQKLYWYLSLSFAVLLILSNTVANRLFIVGNIVLPSAIVIFPITYIIGDVVTEIFGYKQTRRLIVTALALNCVFVGLGILAANLPELAGETNAAAYRTVFGITPRVAVASITGFLFGSVANAFIMEKMKNQKAVQKYLFVRIFTSTVAGELIDTCLFIGILFIGSLDAGTLLLMMVSQFCAKIVYETVFSPITVKVIKRLNRFIS